MRTDGDIGAVLHSMFMSREFDARLGGKIQGSHALCRVRQSALPTTAGRSAIPVRCSIGSMVSARRPIGRQTPDGYPLTELGWASSGQMSRRFEIARAIGAGSAGLFDPEDGAAASAAAVSAAVEPLVFRSSRTLSCDADQGCAESRELAAGVEYVSTVVTGIQL